ncbi:MAG: GNAT family N-acetyltransferase [Jatrophihabitans sp.]
MSDREANFVTRRATPIDAAEIVRLRALMFEDMGRDPGLLDARWRRRNIDHFTAGLAEPDVFAGYVIDNPQGGLAAVAIGWLDQHLIGTANPTGRVGYIANMCTEPDFRRRGFGRITLTALLDWMRSTDTKTVNLHASADGEALYRSFGFTDPAETALTLRLD